MPMMEKTDQSADFQYIWRVEILCSIKNCSYEANHDIEMSGPGTSMVVQRLRLCPSTSGGMGSIPGWVTKIPHATWHGQEISNFLKDRKK